MNRLGDVILSAVAILALALMPGSAVGEQNTVKEQLVGTWTLASASVERDGTKIEPFGSDPLGYMMFTTSGHFSWNFMRADRHKFASNNRQTGTPEENKAAVQIIATTSTTTYPFKFFSIASTTKSSTNYATSTEYVFNGDTLLATVDQAFKNGSATGTAKTRSPITSAPQMSRADEVIE